MKLWPFKPDDWKPVFAALEEYSICITFQGKKIENTSRPCRTIFTLYYSKSRNKYKIKWSEYEFSDEKAKGTAAYFACLKKQMDLQS